jgi:hypothetical protein
MKKIYLLAIGLAVAASASAAKISVKMNTVSRTMSLVNKATGEAVEVGEPESYVYTFEAPAGTYVLTGYASDGATVNGTIELNFTDEDNQSFSLWTPTVYATNKTGTTYWAIGEDYTIDLTVSSNTGEKQVITMGNSTTAGRATFLALNGNSYYLSFIPSDAHAAEGYMAFEKSGTLTTSSTLSGAIPMGGDFTITVPEDATLFFGKKTAAYIKFTEIEPTTVATEDGATKYTYHIPQGSVYNFRTWKPGSLTLGGYFTYSTTESKRPTIVFTDEDYTARNPKDIEHSTEWNKGCETGNILVNVNERGHLNLSIGETFDALAMRSWQAIDTITNNYYIDPDYHYYVYDVDGNPSTGVIEIENANTGVDPWATIKAVGEGTAIVLVTYDAIDLNYYNANGVKTTYYGGDFWGAIWPENTAAYVVTVGQPVSTANPNMTINVGYNPVDKNAGDYVDAEHDIFYYLDSEEGAKYTFTPEGISKVEIAYPVIGEQMATYKGFGTEGVTANNDGSYTLLLKKGRQIVRLTDTTGAVIYQVLTAKPCSYTVSNVTTPDSEVFYPGDQVTVQFSDLIDPVNKLATIYNMYANIIFNSTPKGITAQGTKKQYVFSSTATAQAATFTIPEDYDVDANPQLVLSDGSIKESGYGDPYGNHRIISRANGRSANFTAASRTCYFSSLPDVAIKVSKRESGVDAIAIDGNSSVATDYYDIAGRRLSAPQRGLNIVRHADGSVTKLIVK